MAGKTTPKTADAAHDLADAPEVDLADVDTTERRLLETVPRGNGTEAQYWLEVDGTITRAVVAVDQDDEAADQ